MFWSLELLQGEEALVLFREDLERFGTLVTGGEWVGLGSKRVVWGEITVTVERLKGGS